MGQYDKFKDLRFRGRYDTFQVRVIQTPTWRVIYAVAGILYVLAAVIASLLVFFVLLSWMFELMVCLYFYLAHS